MKLHGLSTAYMVFPLLGWNIFSVFWFFDRFPGRYTCQLYKEPKVIINKLRTSHSLNARETVFSIKLKVVVLILNIISKLPYGSLEFKFHIDKIKIVFHNEYCFHRFHREINIYGLTLFKKHGTPIWEPNANHVVAIYLANQPNYDRLYRRLSNYYRWGEYSFIMPLVIAFTVELYLAVEIFSAQIMENLFRIDEQNIGKFVFLQIFFTNQWCPFFPLY